MIYYRYKLWGLRVFFHSLETFLHNMLNSAKLRPFSSHQKRQKRRRFFPLCLPNFFQRTTKGVPNGCQSAVKGLPKGYQRDTKGMPKGCQRAAKGLPKDWRRAAEGLPKDSPESRQHSALLFWNSSSIHSRTWRTMFTNFIRHTYSNGSWLRHVAFDFMYSK